MFLYIDIDRRLVLDIWYYHMFTICLSLIIVYVGLYLFVYIDICMDVFACQNACVPASIGPFLPPEAR